MTDRMTSRKIYKNSKKIYKYLREQRGLKFVKHYNTPTFKELTVEDMSTLDIVEETWNNGTRLFKLAHKYYGDSTMWWLIALFNEKPTDSHFSPGDVVYIPMPIEKVLSLYGL